MCERGEKGEKFNDVRVGEGNMRRRCVVCPYI